MADHNAPTRLDLKKDRGLTVEWPDGTSDYFSIAYLRRMSPSADARALRDQLASNPLTVLPSSAASASGQPLTAVAAELVGNYAIRIRFSDGHDTGIYSWSYLRELSREAPRPDPEPDAAESSATDPSKDRTKDTGSSMKRP
jgi:DUF971 family protein